MDRLAHASRWRSRPVAEKALLAFGLLALALILPPFPGGILVLAAALSATLMAGTPPLAWMRMAAAPLGFIAMGAAALMVSVGDGLALTDGRDALTVLVRGAASVSCLLLLTATSPASDLIRGARRLGLSAELAEVTLATYRFVFLLDQTARTIDASQAARLGHDGGRRRLRSAGLLVAALLPRALERARRMEIGLAARGFDGALPTLAPHNPPSPARLMAVLALLASIAGVSAWAA